MKPDQKMGIIFTVIGLAMGTLSTFVGVLILSFMIPIIAYVAVVFLMTKVLSEKKPKWLLTHSIGTFVMVWMISWIFFFNMFMVK